MPRPIGVKLSSHNTSKVTARVLSPHPHCPPYRDTEQPIPFSYLCKGGSDVERCGDPCGRPGGGVGWPLSPLRSPWVALPRPRPVRIPQNLLLTPRSHNQHRQICRAKHILGHAACHQSFQSSSTMCSDSNQITTSELV